MQKVAFIDDGIEACDFKLNVNEGLTLEVVESYNNIMKNESHGSHCFAVFQKYIRNSDFISYSIKILDGLTHHCSIYRLAAALKWCVENKINIINLSLGTTDFNDRKIILPLIRTLLNQECIIVAAASNNMLCSYPSSMEGVFGVKYDYLIKLNKDTFFYTQNPIDGIEIIACCDHPYAVNNSYTAPFITANLYNYMCQGAKTIDQLKMCLLKHTVISEYYSSNSSLTDYYQLSDLKIDIPIVCISGNHIKFELFFMYLLSYLSALQYFCVGLTSGFIKVNTSAFIFDISDRLSEAEAIKLYYKMFRPDIIIVLHTAELSSLSHLCNDAILDIIIHEDNSIDVVQIQNVQMINMNNFNDNLALCAEIVSMLTNS